MLRFRRIMYTSMGSADRGGASLTSTTDAAGFGTTGTAGTPAVELTTVSPPPARSERQEPPDTRSESVNRCSEGERANGSLEPANRGVWGGASRTPPATD